MRAYGTDWHLNKTLKVFGVTRSEIKNDPEIRSEVNIVHKKIVAAVVFTFFLVCDESRSCGRS